MTSRAPNARTKSHADHASTYTNADWMVFVFPVFCFCVAFSNETREDIECCLYSVCAYDVAWERLHVRAAGESAAATSP